MTPQDRARAYSQIAGHMFTAWMQGTGLALLVLAISAEPLRRAARRWP